MKKIFEVSLLITVLFLGVNNIARAEDPAPEPVVVHLTVRSGDSIIFDNDVNLQPAGTISLNDSGGTAHELNADSVLSIINDADVSDDSWSVSDLQYFDSFGAFYLKCIESTAGDNCDNWQYAVDGQTPSSSMDQKILSGSENVYVYFGPQNRITLSSSSLTENDTLTVTTENYDFENNAWTVRTGVTVGLTQPNPADAFNPIEVLTKSVDKNGQTVFSDIPAGEYNVGIKEDFYFPTEALSVVEAPKPAPHSGGGGHSNNKSSKTVADKEEPKSKFDIKKAFEFLIAEQKEDGSFGEDIYTDWSAIALAEGDYQQNVIKLVKYFVENETESRLLTDYERHAMALLALGLNPYNTNGENYIQKITSSFDGKQFGDPNEDNDDIFALIVLQNVGFKTEEKMLSDDVLFVLGKQKENGSWNESVDMTGAAIEALALFNQNEQVKNALTKARGFLDENQKIDGGWGNVSATAWASEGILALGEEPKDWKKNSTSPLDYIATKQDTDGGIKGEELKNRIWETAYALSAYSGKTWNETMQNFEKPKDDGSVLGASTEIKPITPKKVVTKTKIQPPKTAQIENTLTLPTEENNIQTPEPKSENWFLRLIHFIF